MPLTNAPDLTQRPPRSPRVRLGGYACLPRILDKCRATIAGTNGEYNYNCPLDQRFLEFVGVDAKALQKQVATGKGDAEILAWINKNGKHKHNPAAIAAWSACAEQRGPMDVETHQYFLELLTKVAPKRDDVSTWFEILDIDDFATFGGTV